LGRWIAAALGAVCVPVLALAAVEPSNFSATTTRDLVALCSDEPGDALYAEARQFCYGFVAGVAQFHRSVVHGDGMEPIACPQQEITRAELVTVFLDLGQSQPAIDGRPAGAKPAPGCWPEMALRELAAGFRSGQ
jgi:hypothetical protein